MKRIILYSLFGHIMVFVLSISLLKILLRDFNHEMYSFFFYFSVGYNIMNLLVTVLLLKLALGKLSSNKIFMLLAFTSTFMLNIYGFFLSKKILFFENFKANTESGKVSIALHLSILLTIIIAFLCVHWSCTLKKRLDLNRRKII